MYSKSFDPEKFIDRDAEQKIFSDLLTFKDDSRILAIRDKSGTGKSHLLQLFRYRCGDSTPRVPVSLIDLKQLTDQKPLTFITKIVEDLTSRLHAPFPIFKQYNDARLSGVFTPTSGYVDAQNVNFSYASQFQVGGNIQNIQNLEKLNLGTNTSLTPEQETEAQKKCALAFFKDLKNHSDEQPIVILVDSYEKCAEELAHWFVEGFLEVCFFDFEKRPRQLVLVVAGLEVPMFSHFGSTQTTCVKAVKQLSPWNRNHIENCFRLNGHDNQETNKLVDAVHTCVEGGLRPAQVVQWIKSLVAN